MIYMYEKLTKYLDEFTGAEFGTWIVDDKSDGTLEHPLQFPFVDYSRVVDQFIHDVYSFVDNHEEMGLHNYIKLLFCKWVVIIRLFTRFRAHCIAISHSFWRQNCHFYKF